MFRGTVFARADKSIDVEAVNVPQQFGEAIHCVRDQLFSGLGSGRCRIAGHAVRVEIGHLPAEGMRTIGAQMAERFDESGLPGGEVAGLRHVDQFGVQGEHH